MWVTWPILPWNFSASRTWRTAPPAAWSTRPAGSRSFFSSAYTPTTTASAPREARGPFTTDTFMAASARRAPAPVGSCPAVHRSCRVAPPRSPPPSTPRRRHWPRTAFPIPERRRSRRAPNDSECALRHRVPRGRGPRRLPPPGSSGRTPPRSRAAPPPASSRPARPCRRAGSTCRTTAPCRDARAARAGRRGRPRRRRPAGRSGTPARRSRGRGEPVRARVAVGHQAIHARHLVLGEAAGTQRQAVLLLEGLRQRLGDLEECRPAAQRGFERGERGQRIARGRKERTHTRLVDRQQDGAVLQERVALTALRAAHELAPVHLDLEHAGAGEAERRDRSCRRTL